MSLLQNFFGFILPPRCAICGRVLQIDQGICDECIENIDFISDNVCYRCGQPQGDFIDKRGHHICGRCLAHPRQIFRFSRSACAYDNFSQKLILDFKFHDHTDLASLLAKMLYVAGKDIFAAGVDVIIPVPLHYTRLLKRKYNQSALLAKELGKLSGVKVCYNAVIKSKMTRPQVECSGSERLTNVKGAFRLKNVAALQNKHVLLIDDVLTTGTTLKECAYAIKKARPKSIDSLTVARVL